MRHLRVLLRTAVAAIVATTLSGLALADTLTLKSGEVLEGRVVRELEQVIYFEVKIGDVTHTRFIPRSEIASLVMTDAPAMEDAEERADDRGRDSAVDRGTATRIAFITLEEMVGPFMYAPALLEAVERLDDDDVDIVVLRFNSGGGALAEVQPLSDAIHEEIKPDYRVVAWIESAISAAALTAFNCEDMYMMSEGNIGGAVAFQSGSGGAKALDGEDLQRVLYLGEIISVRGNRNPLIMRAMQEFMTLSADIDEETGEITWHENDEGQILVSPEDRIITFNALESLKYGVAHAIADTKDELARAMGVTEWVEVGHDADEYMQQFRENVARAQVEINELMQKMNIAMQAGQPARARRFLGEIRTWTRRAPSMEKYSGLTREWFNEMERQIREMQRQQAERDRSRQRR